MGFVAVVPAGLFNNIDRCDNVIRDKLKLGRGRHELSNDEALKVLKSIERKAKVVSFITKPAVLILTGLLSTGISIGLYFAAGVTAAILPLVALQVAACFMLTIGGVLLTFGFGKLTQDISLEFHERALEARNYIEQLEADEDSKLLLS